MNSVEVYIDLRQVGRLTIDGGVRPIVTFQYDPAWLSAPDTFAIDPELALEAAPFTRIGSLFGAMRDSAPDDWGRGLLARSAPGRILTEADYLLDVSDNTRQGALRYRDVEGQWLTTWSSVPLLMDLPTLQAAAREAEVGLEPPLRELAAAGAGTGGARPKVVVADGDDWWIAKFGRRDDLIETESAEHVVAQLARRAGIEMSDTTVVHSSGEPILLTRRFDRTGSRRRAYLSALSLLEHTVGSGRAGVYDYLELADVLPEWSSEPTKDLHQLWRRIAFGAVVRNTDDHMRNHGFVRIDRRWRLSPAFDINCDVRSWTPFVTSIDTEVAGGRLEALLEAAEYFRMDADHGRRVLAEIVAAVDTLGDLKDDRMPADTWGHIVKVVREGASAARALLS